MRFYFKLQKILLYGTGDLKKTASSGVLHI